MNGYTQTIDRETKRHNELHATVEILIANPENTYWQARLAAVRDQVDAEHLAKLIDICNTDPAHVLNAQAEVDDWMQADNAAGLYGEHPLIQKLANDRERNFNRHYYNNPEGKPEFVRKPVRLQKPGEIPF